MQILILGGGGREHALAWKAAQSLRVRKIYVAPGNAGTLHEHKCENLPIEVGDIDRLIAFARDRNIDLTIVGPEVPLVGGVVDRFQAAGLRCFGPTKAAAQLEGSKAFAKEFLARHRIPTAAYAVFTELQAALAYLQQVGAPIVIKADGLAAGKGVVVAQTLAEARLAVEDMLHAKKFGAAGGRVVIEEFLAGEEASFIVMTDSEHVLPLASSQDHKRLQDGDAGPNTGGMGAYSPAPVVTPALHERVMREIILPTVRGMAADGRPYSGFLYAGLMVAPDGTPKVLEYNCRFGDPETQPILLRLQSDLIDLIEATLDRRLHRAEAHWDPRPALGVVMTAAGYPESYSKGETITGLPQRAEVDRKVFHAGTAVKDNAIVTDGGRVLCVTALGETVAVAQRRAYELVENIHWPGAHYRKDIGQRALMREHTTPDKPRRKTS